MNKNTVVGGVIVGLLGTLPVQAQDSTDQTIVVQATRVEKDIKDVPQSIATDLCIGERLFSSASTPYRDIQKQILKIGQNGRPGRQEAPRSISFDQTKRMKSVGSWARVSSFRPIFQ